MDSLEGTPTTEPRHHRIGNGTKVHFAENYYPGPNRSPTTCLYTACGTHIRCATHVGPLPWEHPTTDPVDCKNCLRAIAARRSP